jgi:hypothetical protein
VAGLEESFVIEISETFTANDDLQSKKTAKLIGVKLDASGSFRTPPHDHPGNRDPAPIQHRMNSFLQPLLGEGGRSRRWIRIGRAQAAWHFPTRSDNLRKVVGPHARRARFSPGPEDNSVDGSSAAARSCLKSGHSNGLLRIWATLIHWIQKPILYTGLVVSLLHSLDKNETTVDSSRTAAFSFNRHGYVKNSQVCHARLSLPSRFASRSSSVLNRRRIAKSSLKSGGILRLEKEAAARSQSSGDSASRRAISAN